jgi:NitT/TauT family transport system ATP-binding protein
MSPHPGQVKAEMNSDGTDERGQDGGRLSERIHHMLFSDQIEEERVAHA